MQSDKPTYEQLFIMFSAKVEKVLIRMTLVFLLLLLVAQCLLQIASLRQLLTKVDSLEGKPYLMQEESFSELGPTGRTAKKH
jgi:hypothetical protein